MECWFLIAHHKEIGGEEPDGPIRAERRRTHAQRLAKDNGRDAEIHRISHVSVEAADDKLPWRVDWGQRAASAPCELEDARGQQRYSKDDARETKKLRGLEHVDRRHAEPEESPRHIRRKRSEERRVGKECRL